MYQKVLALGLAIILGITGAFVFPAEVDLHATDTVYLSQNLIGTDAKYITGTSVSMTGGNIYQNLHKGEGAGNPIPYTEKAKMVFEADYNITALQNSKRIGFGFYRKGDSHFAIQGSSILSYNSAATPQSNLSNVTIITSPTKALAAGINWHMKVVVDATDVEMIITDNADNQAVICDVKTTRAALGETDETAFPNGPTFIALGATGTLSGLSARYDITEDVATLETAIETANTRLAALTNPVDSIATTIQSAGTVLATAKAGNGTKAAVVAMIEQLNNLVYAEKEPERVMSQNLIGTDATYISNTSVAMTGGNIYQNLHKGEGAGNPIPYTEKAKMIFEADYNITALQNSKRIGFGFYRKGDSHFAIQGSSILSYNSAATPQSNLSNVTIITSPTKALEAGINWHMKVVVDATDVEMIITDNADNQAVICDVKTTRAALGETDETAFPNGPTFIALGATGTLSGLSARYDITEDVATLETAIETANARLAALTSPVEVIATTIQSAEAVLATAKAGNGTKAAVVDMIEQLGNLEYAEKEPDRILSQNLIGSDEKYISTTSVAMNGNNLYQNLYEGEDANHKKPYTEQDKMIFEGDVAVESFSGTTRKIGFGFKRTADINLAITNLGFSCYPCGSGQNNGLITIRQDSGRYLTEGVDWHVKVIVDADNVEMIITDNADNNKGTVICDLVVERSALLGDQTAFPNGPTLGAVGVVGTWSNLSAKYDITEDVAALQTALATATAEKNNLTNPSDAVVNTIQSAEIILAAAQTGNGVKKDVTDMVTALGALQFSEAASLSIGNGTTSTQISVSIAVGETLPTGNVQGKYIMGWTYEGASVTTMASGTEASKYVPNFFDKKMLSVKVQTKAESGSITARFIGSLDNYARADYDCVGFVLSTKGDPLKATNPRNQEIYRVWNGIYAGGTLKTATDLYDNYSAQLFALDVSGLPSGQTVYARAYVKLADGTIVYGDLRQVEVQ